MVIPEEVWQALKTVNDPEYPLSVVDLGMIYNVAVNNSQVSIEMTFTTIGCPAMDMIVDDVKESVGKLPGVAKVKVEIVWSPPWTKDKITSEGRTILQYYGVNC